MYFLVERKLRRVWKLNRRSQIFSCGGGVTVLYITSSFLSPLNFLTWKREQLPPFSPPPGLRPWIVRIRCISIDLGKWQSLRKWRHRNWGLRLRLWQKLWNLKNIKKSEYVIWMIIESSFSATFITFQRLYRGKRGLIFDNELFSM